MRFELTSSKERELIKKINSALANGFQFSVRKAKNKLPFIVLVAASFGAGYAANYLTHISNENMCLGISYWEEGGRYRSNKIDYYSTMTAEKYKNLKSNPYIHITDVSATQCK